MSNYFVEKLKVPSAAIQAMVDGLREIPDENFKVDMWTYGDYEDEVCYGCAATCAVQQIEQKRYLPEHLVDGPAARSVAVGCSVHELSEFENAIDDLRSGNPNELFFLFGFFPPFAAELPSLRSHTYQEYLEAYEDYANKLREIGL